MGGEWPWIQGIDRTQGLDQTAPAAGSVRTSESSSDSTPAATSPESIAQPAGTGGPRTRIVQALDALPQDGIEWEVIAMTAERLKMGYDTYGAFEPDDGRDWLIEALEEGIDKLVYVVRLLMQIASRR